MCYNLKNLVCYYNSMALSTIIGDFTPTMEAIGIWHTAAASEKEIITPDNLPLALDAYSEAKSFNTDIDCDERTRNMAYAMMTQLTRVIKLYFETRLSNLDLDALPDTETSCYTLQAIEHDLNLLNMAERGYAQGDLLAFIKTFIFQELSAELEKREAAGLETESIYVCLTELYNKAFPEV